MEFNSGNDLLGNGGLLTDESQSFEGERGLHGIRVLSEGDSENSVQAD